MKLIKPKFEILQSEGLYKDIERAARTCYMSQDKIMQGSAEKIVSNLIERGHGAMLEHGTVYLVIFVPKIKEDEPEDEEKAIKEVLIQGFKRSKYSRVKMHFTLGGIYYYITTNYRVIIESGWFAHKPYIVNTPDELHQKRISVRFTCDIGVSREFNRHRVDSIAEQSTRYCNFSKEQFGNEVTFIQPNWVTDDEVSSSIPSELVDIQHFCHDVAHSDCSIWNAFDYWLFSLMVSEFSYLGCLKKGWVAQQARDCLTLSAKTELIHTAFVSDWNHFFELRDAVPAHPSAKELATPLHEEFKRLKLI
jgi:thymidylate synthase (FAD)